MIQLLSISQQTIKYHTLTVEIESSPKWVATVTLSYGSATKFKATKKCRTIEVDKGYNTK
jgi:hypothetical protein